ncbi:hypothetical protein B0H19DRAFT_942762, partial [Mycena capillaripes]
LRYLPVLTILLDRVDMSLFIVDSQSLFKVDVFAQRAVAASSVATVFSLLCDGWFLGRYYRLQTREFLIRARDMYDSFVFFSLSARLPSVGATISLLALGAFAGRIAYRTLPAFVTVLGIMFCLIMGLQFIVRGTEMVYFSVAEVLSTVVGWMQLVIGKARGRVENNLHPPIHTLAEAESRPPV